MGLSAVDSLCGGTCRYVVSCFALAVFLFLTHCGPGRPLEEQLLRLPVEFSQQNICGRVGSTQAFFTLGLASHPYACAGPSQKVQNFKDQRRVNRTRSGLNY